MFKLKSKPDGITMLINWNNQELIKKKACGVSKGGQDTLLISVVLKTMVCFAWVQ